MTPTVSHGFSIDVEDWFQVFYGEAIIPRTRWQEQSPEFPAMASAMLDFLDEANIKATFFMVGWLAKQHPATLRQLEMAGHEIASHGYWHREAYQTSPSEFFDDIYSAKNCLEDIIGNPIAGYRAPGYSISRSMPWAIDAIAKAGYQYDSSLLFAPAGLSRLENGLIEVAPHSLSVGGKHLPINGGFFFRAVPYLLYVLYVKHLQRRETPLIFYTHSWEVHATKNRIPMHGLRKFVQYYNMPSVRPKLLRLCRTFPFVPLRQLVESYIATIKTHEIYK